MMWSPQRPSTRCCLGKFGMKPKSTDKLVMKIDWIEPGILAASSIPLDVVDIRSLHEQGIRAIVTLTEVSLFARKSIPPDIFHELDILMFHASIPDGEPPEMEQAYGILAFIDKMTAE